MNNKFIKTLIIVNGILTLVLIISACTKKSTETISTDNGFHSDTTREITTDTSTVAQRNYWNSMIHHDFDNDSLLLDSPELKKLVRSFTSKPKVKENMYGAGDYFGKYRVYADKLDTLIIEKGDGGDYGFGNTIYLQRRDSLILYRHYKFDSFVSGSEQIEEITEQLVTFHKGTMDFKQRKMTTKNWSQLKCSINFETVDKDPNKTYKLLGDELRDLYKKELIE